MRIVFGIILIVAALALIAVVLFQSGKDKTLSSAIAGGNKSDSYYGKNKAKSSDKILEKITAAVAILFVLIVLVSFIVQKDSDIEPIRNDSTSDVTDVATDTEDAAVSADINGGESDAE